MSPLVKIKSDKLLIVSTTDLSPTGLLVIAMKWMARELEEFLHHTLTLNWLKLHYFVC